MGQLDGKVAVVTGATTGIGLASARRFAQEGARVFIIGRRKAELDAAVEHIGAQATGVQGDVSVPEDLDRLFAAVRERGLKVDVLFANAGGGAPARLGEISERHFDETFGTNVKGLLFTVQKALPLMNDGASVILTSSIAGSAATESFSVYGASKAAVRSLARTLTAELKGRGIRVNAISPGGIDTPGMTGHAATEEEAEKLRTVLASSIPLGRMGRPEEVAGAALFLASDQSSFVAGIELFVDGGANQV